MSCKYKNKEKKIKQEGASFVINEFHKGMMSEADALGLLSHAENKLSIEEQLNLLSTMQRRIISTAHRDSTSVYMIENLFRIVLNLNSTESNASEALSILNRIEESSGKIKEDLFPRASFIQDNENQSYKDKEKKILRLLAKFFVKNSIFGNQFRNVNEFDSYTALKETIISDEHKKILSEYLSEELLFYVDNYIIPNKADLSLNRISTLLMSQLAISYFMAGKETNDKEIELAIKLNSLSALLPLEIKDSNDHFIKYYENLLVNKLFFEGTDSKNTENFIKAVAMADEQQGDSEYLALLLQRTLSIPNESIRNKKSFVRNEKIPFEKILPFIRLWNGSLNKNGEFLANL